MVGKSTGIGADDSVLRLRRVLARSLIAIGVTALLTITCLASLDAGDSQLVRGQDAHSSPRVWAHLGLGLLTIFMLTVVWLSVYLPSLRAFSAALEQQRSDSDAAVARQRELDARLHNLAAHVPGVLFEFLLRTDGTSCFLHAGARMKELLGVDPLSVRHDATLAWNAIHPEDVPAMREGMLASLQSLQVWTQEMRVVLPHGETRWLRSHATPQRQSDGATLWSGVFLDCTPMKQAELREREAAAMLAEAESMARLGSWAYDLRTRSVEWSPQMYALFGRDPALGPPDYLSALNYYVPEDAARAARASQTVVETGAPYQGVLRVLSPHNGVAVLRAHAKVDVDAAGRRARIFGTVIDITATVEREAALQKAQAQAEAASHAKSVFLANMSHEIRTPMAAILGYLEVLSDQQLARVQWLEYTAIVQRNAKHLLELINQVLDLSKIEAGQMTTEKLACSPGALVREVASLMRPQAAEKGIDFRLEFRGALPSTILTDPTRLRQILLNLVGNAVKFTERGGVTVVIGMVEGREPPQLELQVRDTGIGIEPEALQHLFKPFTQGDESTTRRFGGTGLGLSIASHLCRLLGGSIDAVSTPGEGSVFTARVETGSLEGVLLLDGQTESSTALSLPSARQEGLKPLQGLRVLLVEDGLDNQRVLSLHLERAGAIVEVLGNGRLALDRLNDPALPMCEIVLMDMQMPVLDGYAATATLRAQGYPGPIVALTAHALAGERQKCLDAGCDDYAIKPVSQKQLVSMALKHTRSRVGGGPWTLPDEAPPPRPPIASQYENDPELADLIAQFVRVLPDRAAQIEVALASGDMPRLATLAHQLKGAGGSYGLKVISEAAAALERNVLQGARPELLNASVMELVSICRAVRTPPVMSKPAAV